MTASLPDKLSALLRAALGGLEKAEKSPQYEIDMRVWHNASPGPHAPRCFVCLVGALMAFSLGVPIKATAHLSDFDAVTRQKLKAVDYLRLGYVESAFYCCEMSLPAGVMANYSVATYGRDTPKFKRDMRRIADILEGAGH